MPAGLEIKPNYTQRPDVVQNQYPVRPGELGVTDVRYPVGDVRRYGAVVNGVDDDRTALQRAIKAVVLVGGGDVVIPAGTLVIKSGIDLTGLFFTTPVKIRGAGKYGTKIKPAYVDAAKPVMDLSGSNGLAFEDFQFQASGSHGEILLLARTVGDATSGFHVFRNVIVNGNVAHAVMTMWGSEENAFYSCEFNPVVDKPAIAAAVKMSELGIVPASDYVALGTGTGGVGMNRFYGCRFANEQALPTTSALVKVYGGLGWKFDSCYSAHPGARTYELSSSTYPSNPANAYPVVATFDSCSDEDAWTAAPIVKDSIYIAEPAVPAVPVVKGLQVRNCQFFNITAGDNTIVDGFLYDGGKYSNSVPAPVSPTNGKKISFFKLNNSRIAPSKVERALNYEVRSLVDSVEYVGIDNGKVAPGAGAYTITDSAHSVVHSGGLTSKSASAGIGYEAGAGGTVVQATSATTAVTLNKMTGRITTVAQTLAAGASLQFQVNNTGITSVDAPHIWIQAYAGNGEPEVQVRSVAAGAFVIRIRNKHATDALNAAITIGMVILRGSIA